MKVHCEVPRLKLFSFVPTTHFSAGIPVLVFVRPPHCDLKLYGRCLSYSALPFFHAPQVRQTARRKEIEVWDGMSVTELAGQLKTSHGMFHSVAVYIVRGIGKLHYTTGGRLGFLNRECVEGSACCWGEGEGKKSRLAMTIILLRRRIRYMLTGDPSPLPLFSAPTRAL